MEYDPWPSFQEVAPTASRIIIGEVQSEESGGAVFDLDVQHVLRGEGLPGQTVEIRFLTSGLPRVACADGTFARVEPGDVIAIATGGVTAGNERVNTLAFIRGMPNAMHMRGVEELSIETVLASVGRNGGGAPEEEVGPIAASLLGLMGILVAAAVIVAHLRSKQASD